MAIYKRGMVVFVDLGVNIGSEVNKKRPCVIVQNDIGNKHSRTVIVLPISHRPYSLPTHIEIKDDTMEGKTKVDGIIMAEQVRVIDKKRIDGFAGILTEEAMANIDKALAISLGLISLQG